MRIDMSNYKEEDIKEPAQIAFLNGYMGAYNDIDCALAMYRENVLSEIPTESMRKTAEEICSSFAEYVKQYVHDQRDMAIVSMLDDQTCGEESGGGR